MLAFKVRMVEFTEGDKVLSASKSEWVWHVSVPQSAKWTCVATVHHNVTA
jgi:hypothetical protein